MGFYGGVGFSDREISVYGDGRGAGCSESPLSIGVFGYLEGQKKDGFFGGKSLHVRGGNAIMISMIKESKGGGEMRKFSPTSARTSEQETETLLRYLEEKLGRDLSFSATILIKKMKDDGGLREVIDELIDRV